MDIQKKFLGSKLCYKKKQKKSIWVSEVLRVLGILAAKFFAGRVLDTYCSISAVAQAPFLLLPLITRKYILCRNFDILKLV